MKTVVATLLAWVLTVGLVMPVLAVGSQGQHPAPPMVALTRQGSDYPSEPDAVVKAFFAALPFGSSIDYRIYLSPSLHDRPIPLLLGVQNFWDEVIVAPADASSTEHTATVRVALIFGTTRAERIFRLSKSDGRWVIDAVIIVEQLPDTGSGGRAAAHAGITMTVAIALIAAGGYAVRRSTVHSRR